MSGSNNWSVGQARPRLPTRFMHALVKRVKRRVVFPGDAPIDVAKRVATFVLGWGAVIALLTWGGYSQGILHGLGDGVWFCVVLFGLALVFSPDYSQPGGSQSRTQY